ncbi:MAG: aromatic ring-hydroxylating dioxygenase subunit alpha [Anaerolineae bacterium]|nr:aromatic ring-hydroxylating dioxygenase subunit alpha [Anaerolineae bacterium]
MYKVWRNEPLNPDLARAYTLDAGWYLDPALFEIERERIFARTWQVVARADQIPKPGDYLATDAVGEPIVLVRDTQDQVRAYYNVCPHRAGAVARGQGSRKTLQCLYHGWTFGLDGKLLRVPGFEGNEDFDPGCFGLKPVRVEQWGPYLFVNLDDRAPALRDIWGEAFLRTSGIRFSDWRLVERSDYLIDCNWKVYMDNYAEGYHVPMAHPGLNREMNLDDYQVDTYPYYSTQWVNVKPGTQGNLAKRRYTTPQPDDKICYHVVFPNFMIDTYPDNISVNLLKPVAVDKTLLTFEWYFRDDVPDEARESMVKFADEIQYEDIEICEYVQTNLKSRSYHTGRFSARHENGVHHFQGLVARFVNSDDPWADFSVEPDRLAEARS